jgi:hypothetical protein
MFLMGLGALRVLGGFLYMARTAILAGISLAGRLARSRHGAAWDFWGTNWPGILLMASGQLVLGASF